MKNGKWRRGVCRVWKVGDRLVELVVCKMYLFCVLGERRKEMESGGRVFVGCGK